MTSRNRKRLVLLCTLVLGCVVLSLCAGRYPSLSLRIPLTGEPLDRVIFLNIRLPRVLFSFIVGSVLGICGLVFQTLLNNPMVEPGFLGVTQGATFGAALGLFLFPPSAWTLQLMAIVFAFAAFGVTLIFAERIRGFHWLMRLVLAGIASSALFSSALGLVKYCLDTNDRLLQLTYWIMGGLKGAAWDEILPILPVLTIAIGGMFAFRWRLNLLSLDDDTASSMSVNVRFERRLFFFGAVICTAVITALVGNVGWVGLAAPHVARRLFGADLRWSFPAAGLTGAILVVLSDLIARTLFPVEIPISAITAAVGGALFIGILSRREK